ncbi:flagellar hook protein FlgE [Motilibacter aurantiacus]|uniref:flagellar hook protein FlgE n=1 Tax=Motilibacter aurantiacus TaxID=2714955 RepID=UPI0014080C27|nr:flagellar hook protein FlgE [Motilibacter aurantiacus]
MLRSLFSGISGLKQHQTMMDVTGNNISNVNTAGFKSSSTVFEDTLSQMVRAAGAPQGGNGGTNPAQVGLGVRLGGIATNFGQGSAQTTGRATDIMIQGDGFFGVRTGGETLFTRNGSFSFDQDGRLVTNSGGVVQGWTAQDGAINTNGAIGDIQLPTGTLLDPKATTSASLGGNLPAGAAVGTQINGSYKTFDAQGKEHTLAYTLTKAAGTATTDRWTLTTTVDGAAAAASTAALEFSNTDGRLVTPAPAGTPATQAFTVTAPWGPVSIDVGTVSSFGGENTLAAGTQDGSAMGSLQAFTISPDGTLVGVFSNGLKQPLAQLSLASFNNPAGLEKVGGSMFRNSVNSGNPIMGVAGSAGRGTLQNNTLEMSNVDLAAEFTNLIVAQRGFQANSKVITTSDEILNDLVNLKR